MSEKGEGVRKRKKRGKMSIEGAATFIIERLKAELSTLRAENEELAKKNRRLELLLTTAEGLVPAPFSVVKSPEDYAKEIQQARDEGARAAFEFVAKPLGETSDWADFYMKELKRFCEQRGKI